MEKELSHDSIPKWTYSFSKSKDSEILKLLKGQYSDPNQIILTFKENELNTPNQ